MVIAACKHSSASDQGIMIGSWTDADDRLLARSVFETDDSNVAQRLILDWTVRQGFSRGCISSIELSVAAAATVTLPDRSQIFVKVWPGNVKARPLVAQMELQAAMATRGCPAPAVLTKLAPLGPGWAVAMEHNRAGVPTDVRISGVRRAMASSLARFVVAAEAYRDLDGLPQRPLPAKGTIWPDPHNALFDFTATTQGAAWIDEIARTSIEAMRSARSRIVVGHHDWSAKNMRMGLDGIAVLYDWDAVSLDREAFVLGSAAAHFPVTWELNVPETPQIGEVAAFVQEYEQARGLTFISSELAEVAASATYARAYKARCEHAIDPKGGRWRGSSRESLKINGPFRFAR